LNIITVTACFVNKGKAVNHKICMLYRIEYKLLHIGEANLNLAFKQTNFNLPRSFSLKSLAHLSRLVREHVFELFVFLSHHLDFTFAEHDVFVNRANHILVVKKAINLRRSHKKLTGDFIKLKQRIL